MIKEFIDNYGVNLVIEKDKKNIILKTNYKNIERDYYLNLHFNKDVFIEIANYLEIISKDIWEDFEPKIANSLSSDYEEYYDRKYDNNGYLHTKDTSLKLERPDDECPYMYKFNKRRMESFIYDLKNNLK